MTQRDYMRHPFDLDVIYLDANMFAQEGFTSGLLILVREMLKRFQQRGKKAGIISITGCSKTTNWRDTDLRGLQYREEQGIPVFEYLMGYDVNIHHLEETSRVLDTLLKKVSPKLILMSVPAVFLYDMHIQFLKKANDSGSKVINILVDELFPIKEQHSAEKIDALYSELKKTEVICISERIRQKFLAKTSIKARRFANLFSLENVCVDNDDDRSGLYITLINHHPIKGRAIFNSLALEMPERDFLIVENWPDVPEYIPPSKNVTFFRFCQYPREVYKRTSILLVPSLCQEGAARVVTEAMLNGVPVIAHRIGSLPELGENMIHWVKPPSILETTMNGTILEPQIHPADIKRVTNDFRCIIKEIEASPESRKKHSLKAKEAAFRYCEESEKLFSYMSKSWFEDK